MRHSSSDIYRSHKLKCLACLAVCLCALLAFIGCSTRPEAAVEDTALPSAVPTACTHEQWENGVCTTCREHCSHPAWQDGKCAVCALPCEHPLWEDGQCAVCGSVCGHTAWEDGACACCGYVCPHEHHDAESRVCSLCGKAVPHKYSDCACTRCGAELSFRTTEIPAEEYAPCPEPGTVETVSYIAPNYRQAGVENAVPEREKPMVVYLPYGYDPAEQYDVLVLLHGAGCDENYYLNQSHKCWGKMICGKDIIDNMIYTGVCEKMIVACPTIFYNDDLGQHRFYNVSAGGYYYDNELRNDILPYLAEHYSTYAADGSQEALKAARAHFGFCGFSMGSVVGYMSVLSECSDLFGWIGCLGSFASSSVYGTTVYAINSALSREEFDDCPIYFLYNGGGESDPAWQEQEPLCRMLIDASDKLDESNTALVGGYKAVHEGKSWILGMYNCLHVFFSLPEQSPAP